jgi:hypothetical protein
MDAVVLPDDRIAVLTETGKIALIDLKGRYTTLALQLPGEEDYQPWDLALDASGEMLAVASGRVYRVFLDGRVVALSDPADQAVGVAPLEDGGFLYTTPLLVRRMSPDGSVRTVAGSGRQGPPRPGPALASPLQGPDAVAATPDGGVVFDDSGDATWYVSPDGSIRQFAGGGTRAVTPDARPATTVYAGNVGDILVAGDGTVVMVSDGGVYAVRDGLISELIRSAREPDTTRSAPLWSGAFSHRASVPGAVAATITRAGEWVVAHYGGVVLFTSAAVSGRLAVAMHPSSVASVWRRSVRIVTTRPARVVLRASVRGRRIVTVTTNVAVGQSEVRLPRRLPEGLVRLTLTAHSPDGAAATHRLPVLGSRKLPVNVARAALAAYGDNSGGDVAAEAKRCTALDDRRVRCRLVVYSETDAYRSTHTMTIRADGWIWTTSGHQSQRLELAD